MKTKHTVLKTIVTLLLIGVPLMAVGPGGGLAPGRAYAQVGTATIGGSIFTGSQLPGGGPNYTSADPLMDARVMVQDKDHGDFVT